MPTVLQMHTIHILFVGLMLCEIGLLLYKVQVLEKGIENKFFIFVFFDPCKITRTVINNVSY